MTIHTTYRSDLDAEVEIKGIDGSPKEDVPFLRPKGLSEEL